jgi:LacI family transcriptional regulator, gluconate utilization system Gnt-I transcriptional repressor
MPLSSVTLADVAARAGVSTITASRALTAPGKLAAKTHAHVLAVMQELGYVPNLVAGALASARTRAVGVLVPTIANSVFVSTVEGISETLEPRGYAVLLAQSGYDCYREERTLAALLAWRPEALVLVGSPATDKGAAMLRRAGVRVVETWVLPRAPIDAAVGFDNTAVGAAVAERFIAAGRRRLAYLGRDDVRGMLRFAGFRRAARDAGVRMPRKVIVSSPGSSDASAREVSRLGDADAVFTSTDAYAAGVLTGLRAAGRAVPQDVALIGLGDLEIGRHLNPALTTVRIDGRRIGATAAELVLSQETSKVIDVGFEFVIRASG